VVIGSERTRATTLADATGITELRQIAEIALRVDRDAFGQRFPAPWLIGVGDGWNAASAAPFRTAVDATNTTPSDLRVGADARVWALVKRVPAFPGKIMLGRAPNNDVVLAHANLSKLHAFFTIDADRTTVADAGSRNGTHRNDEPLVAMEPVVLEDQDVLRFGADVRLVYLASATLHDAVHAGLMGAPRAD
jgi:hypothetical protein